MQKGKEIGEIDKEIDKKNRSDEIRRWHSRRKSECKKKNKPLVLIKNKKKDNILSSTDDKLFFHYRVYFILYEN